MTVHVHAMWSWLFVCFVCIAWNIVGASHPYDKVNGAFSPNGDLLQLEYARKACKLGSSAIGGISHLESDRAIICLPESPRKLKLLDPRHSTDKIAIVDDNIVVVCAGLVSDAQYLIDEARKYSLGIHSTLGQPASPRSVAMHVARLFHGRTLDPRTRPFGVEALVIGSSPSTGKVEMLALDPSGEVTECFGRCIGKGSKSLQRKLEGMWKTEWKIGDWLTGLKDIVRSSSSMEFDSGDGVGPSDSISASDIFEIEFKQNGRLKLTRKEF